MLAVEKWGQGRPPLLLEVSQLAALNAEAVFELCKLGREPNSRQRVARFEDKRRWISNYRKQSHVFFPAPAFGSQFVPGTAKSREAAREVLQSLESWLSMSQRQRLQEMENLKKEMRGKVTWADMLADMRDARKSAKRAYRAHIVELEKMVAGDDTVTPRESRLFAESQDARFFLLVALPCWIEHGVSAKELFERARGGEFESMRKLLSIDPYCLEDTKLRSEHASLLERSNLVRRRMLANAASLEPLRRVTSANVKILIAAYVYKLWTQADAASIKYQDWLWKRNVTALKAYRFTLTYPNLQRLFDAAYQDLHKEGLADPELPRSPDAFRKAVSRQLDFWPDIS